MSLIEDIAEDVAALHFRLGSTKVYDDHYLKHLRKNRRGTAKANDQAKKQLTEPYISYLRLQRQLSGLSQQKLAGLLRTKQSAISRFECGLTSPTMSFLMRYAKAVGVELVLTIKVKKKN